jgi:hypothetical protein
MNRLNDSVALIKVICFINLTFLFVSKYYFLHYYYSEVTYRLINYH